MCPPCTRDSGWASSVHEVLAYRSWLFSHFIPQTAAGAKEERLLLTSVYRFG